MKKKVLALAIAAVVGVSMAGCGSSAAGGGAATTGGSDTSTASEATETQQESTKEEATEATEKAAAGEVSDADFEVTEYKYASEFSESTTWYVVVKNNSKVPVGINSNGTAKDKDGKTLAAGDLYIDVVGPGETGIGSFYFDTDKDVATVDYKLSYDTDVYYIPVVSDLSTEEVQNDEDVVVTVTNNGEAAAQYVNVYCLFFDKKDNVIGSDWSYATDSDSEIKPGESQSVQLKNYDKFDHYKIFMTGYRYE